MPLIPSCRTASPPVDRPAQGAADALALRSRRAVWLAASGLTLGSLQALAQTAEPPALPAAPASTPGSAATPPPQPGLPKAPGAGPAAPPPTPASTSAPDAPAQPRQTAPATRPSSTPKPSSNATQLERVDILGGSNDTEARRQSTAAKIVVGREEIERFGDATVAEVLKRLPGVTIGGRPGRGGDIRMRGLGSGYTQILVNGDRIPPGFDVDSLSPEQVERIEVLRAPTAETGARAIAGTINIVLREEVKRRLNDVKFTLANEQGYTDPTVSWTRADAAGPFSYNLSATANHRHTLDASTGLSTRTQLSDGSLIQRVNADSASQSIGDSVHLGGRMQWRLSAGETVALTPFAILSQNSNHSSANRTATLGALAADDYGHYDSRSESSFALMRLNGQWNKRLQGGDRFELKAGSSLARYRNTSHRDSVDAFGQPLPAVDGSVNNREVSATAGAKYTRLLANEHSLSLGGEVDNARRLDRQTTLSDGVPVAPEFGDEIQAQTLRTAVWAQDDWSFNPNWAAYAGLRWEGIETRSTYGSASSLPDTSNRSSVWTPLLHSVWKLDDKGKQQVRASLTRSYRSPTLSNLIGRPTLSRGANAALTPDRAGNVDLKPELATGIDVAFEHYFSAGGLLSVNVFHRRLHDYIRTTTLLENVTWSDAPRYVARPRNIGDASTSGIELEAKFRLDEVLPGTPGVNLRSNLSLFRSQVDSVPGPNNRLDSQPKATANLGLDYRFRGLPLQVGGNVNWTPASQLTLSDTQSSSSGIKQSFDAFMVWTFDPTLQLRLSANNVVPRDSLSGTSFVVADTAGNPAYTDISNTTARTYRNVAVRLEMKL